MKRDLHHLLEVPSVCIDPGAKTDGTVNGSSADLKGYFSAMVILDAQGAYTDGTHTLTVQESSDNSNWSAVAAADLEFDSSVAAIQSDGTIVINDAAHDDLLYKIGYAGSERYIRAVLVTASSTTGAVLGACILRGHKALKGKLNQ